MVDVPSSDLCRLAALITVGHSFHAFRGAGLGMKKIPGRRESLNGQLFAERFFSKVKAGGQRLVAVLFTLSVLTAVKNVTWRQIITNEVLYAGLPWISTIIRERRLRFSGYYWRSKNEVVRDLVLWEPKDDKRSVGGQADTFVDLLEADTGVPRDSDG